MGDVDGQSAERAQTLGRVQQHQNQLIADIDRLLNQIRDLGKPPEGTRIVADTAEGCATETVRTLI